MSDLTWTQFTKKIHINTSLEKLYWCWATKEGITTWFLKDAKFIRNGNLLKDSDYLCAKDQYTWFWHNWDGQEEGSILEANGKDYFRFSFAGNCEVEIAMQQQENAILLSLKQSKIPLDEKSKLQIFYGCSNGWTFWLTNLKAYLEHGILLNETKIDLRGFDLAGYEFVNM
ncbi:MAG: SRPBCC domain-containing protein [Gelidibacter sp.]|nr:SRPBCC domain-containing protein [Gelidibacter sp.]